MISSSPLSWQTLGLHVSTYLEVRLAHVVCVGQQNVSSSFKNRCRIYHISFPLQCNCLSMVELRRYQPESSSDYIEKNTAADPITIYSMNERCFVVLSHWDTGVIFTPVAKFSLFWLLNSLKNIEVTRLFLLQLPADVFIPAPIIISVPLGWGNEVGISSIRQTIFSKIFSFWIFFSFCFCLVNEFFHCPPPPPPSFQPFSFLFLIQYIRKTSLLLFSPVSPLWFPLNPV